MSFAESVILLLLTAGLTGLLVPTIKGILDNQTFQRQKRFEAELARQGKIIEAQSQFLDEFSQQLWRFRYLAMAVSYYRPDQQPEKYQAAVDQYDQEVWDILIHIRASISKARRLISDNAYHKLVTFYKEKLVKLDSNEVRPVIMKQGDPHRLNRIIFTELTDDIDEMIHFLSKELKLTTHQDFPG